MDVRLALPLGKVDSFSPVVDRLSPWCTDLDSFRHTPRRAVAGSWVVLFLDFFEDSPF